MKGVVRISKPTSIIVGSDERNHHQVPDQRDLTNAGTTESEYGFLQETKPVYKEQ